MTRFQSSLLRPFLVVFIIPPKACLGLEGPLKMGHKALATITSLLRSCHNVKCFTHLFLIVPAAFSFHGS